MSSQWHLVSGSPKLNDSPLPTKGNAQVCFDVFFYGLFMDERVLASKGVIPRNPRLAFVSHHIVKLGAKAMLLPSFGQKAYGMLYQLNQDEMDRLYVDQHDYRTQTLSATIVGLEEKALPQMVISMVHIDPPIDSAQNPEYSTQWMRLIQRLGIAHAESTDGNGAYISYKGQHPPGL